MGRQQPGILVYFDVAPLFEDLTDEEVGQIFKAMLNYGATGQTPSFEDRAVKTAWNRVQVMVEQDVERYRGKKLAGEYAAYCKHCKQRGEQAAPFDMWSEYQHLQAEESEPP